MLRKSLLLALGVVVPVGVTGLWMFCGDCCKSKVVKTNASCCEETASDAAVEAEFVTASVFPLAGAAEPQGATGDASVKGVVKFEGAAPARDKIDMAADAVCAKLHTEALTKEDMIVGKDGGLRNVFVYVKKGIDGKYEPPKESFVLDQKGCQYIPHVFGVVAGQKITVKNSDATTHNVHSFGKKNKAINQAQPAGSKEIEVDWKTSEVNMAIKCDMHPWMSSYCHIVKHPFFAVTDDSGKFEIKNLPAGDYTIEAVHEGMPPQTMEVKVAAKESRDANFTFKK
jgi:plastocyanin